MVAIVLLPGMDGTGSLFSEFITALGSDMPSIVASYPTDQALGYAELEPIARSFLPLSQPFVLLGESFSGSIAISLAAAHPMGLRGVILCCSFARNPQPLLGWLRGLVHVLPVQSLPSPVLNWLLLGRFSSEYARVGLAQALAHVSPAALRARVQAVLSVDVSAKLAQLRVPVLYLQAREDRVVSRASAEFISRSLPHVQVVEVDAPHFLLQAVPSPAAGYVRDFVHAVAFGP